MRRTALYMALAAATALGSVSCGGDNPAAPQAQAPAASAPTTESGAAASGLPEVNAVNATQSWTVQDACSDGKGIRMRLWEAKLLRLTGRATRVFATRNNLGTLRFRLICVRGNNSCLGATTNPASSVMWGVGLNAERRPAKPFCKPCSTTGINFRLLCPRRLNGDLDLLVEELEGPTGGDLEAAAVSDEGDAVFEAVSEIE